MPSSHQIARLRVPTEDEWPGEIRAVAVPFAERLGFVPNIMRAFALMPGHFLGWWTYFDDLMRGSSNSNLTKAQREMIAVVVSKENNCHYLMLAHGAACRLRTKDPILVDKLLTNYRIADLDPRERVMLDFAVKVTEASARVGEEDLEALRRAGWTDEDIMHITEIAAMFNYTGRLANTVGLIANPEYNNLGRSLKEAD
jgi:uncharacterized peroxidase-related enzyme